LNSNGIESWLAIETSGHAALRENSFLDDGAFLMTKILVKAAQMRLKGLSYHTLTEKLILPAESQEFRINIETPDFKTYGNQVISNLLNYVQQIDGWQTVPDNHEGIRVSCGPNHGDGWFLLRLSLHDPVMPLNIESNRPGGISVISSSLSEFFRDQKGLHFPQDLPKPQ